MIDTLMAFWNQNRRRRAAQVFLTFFLMCISISLLFVAMSLPQWSHTHPQGSITGKVENKGSTATSSGATGIATPTIVVQITQEPQTKPTSTIIVPSQATPTPSGSASSCTTPDAQVNVNATTSTNVAPLQVTPYATATPTVTPDITPTVTGMNGTPRYSPAQQNGGGPLNNGTPVSASPVPGSTPPGSTQHIGGGWISACNSNDIGMIAGENVVAVVWQHLWLILAASLMCTALFYGIVWRVNKNRT